MYSLLQKCCGMMCNLDGSKKNLKDAAGHVSISCREAVTKLVSGTLLSSSDCDEMFKKTIVEQGHQTVSELDLKYARLAIRVAEKDFFVNGFSLDSQKNFILHLAKALPPLLQDLAMVADVSTVLSTFFGAFTSAHAAGVGHDTAHSRDPSSYLSDEENVAIVKKIEEGFAPMVAQVYSLLEKTAQIRSNAKAPHLLIGMSNLT